MNIHFNFQVEETPDEDATQKEDEEEDEGMTDPYLKVIHRTSNFLA